LSERPIMGGSRLKGRYHVSAEMVLDRPLRAERSKTGWEESIAEKCPIGMAAIARLLTLLKYFLKR